jgi:hypothetical protein
MLISTLSKVFSHFCDKPEAIRLARAPVAPIRAIEHRRSFFLLQSRSNMFKEGYSHARNAYICCFYHEAHSNLFLHLFRLVTMGMAKFVPTASDDFSNCEKKAFQLNAVVIVILFRVAYYRDEMTTFAWSRINK